MPLSLIALAVFSDERNAISRRDPSGSFEPSRPILYHLPGQAGKDEIAAVKTELVAKLVEALSAFKPAETTALAPAFPETPPKIGKAFFFGDGEVLGRSEHDDVEFVMPFRSVFYLRVIPVKPPARPLPLELLLTRAGRYGAFGSNVGVYIRSYAGIWVTTFG
jgi:hypothetical protein